MDYLHLAHKGDPSQKTMIQLPWEAADTVIIHILLSPARMFRLMQNDCCVQSIMPGLLSAAVIFMT